MSQMSTEERTSRAFHNLGVYETTLDDVERILEADYLSESERLRQIATAVQLARRVAKEEQ